MRSKHQGNKQNLLGDENLEPFLERFIQNLVLLLVCIFDLTAFNNFQGSLLFSDFDLITVEFGFVLSLSF